MDVIGVRANWDVEVCCYRYDVAVGGARSRRLQRRLDSMRSRTPSVARLEKNKAAYDAETLAVEEEDRLWRVKAAIVVDVWDSEERQEHCRR